MTQVYLHPEIEDHFVEYDFGEVLASPPDGSANDLRRRLMEDYVGERCILLRNVRVDYDKALVRSIEFPHTWEFKKFPSRMVEAETEFDADPNKQKICNELFHGDRGLYDAFAAELARVNNGIRTFLDEILRHHAVTKRDIVWRHTETRVENLHFDIDKNSGAFESVRMYFNMDDAPRIWHTTHGLTQLINVYYDQLALQTLAAEPLERLLHRLSVRLFGNWESRGREQFPRHMALFEPDDVWIVDGRTVPHQVLYGRRVISTFYRLDQTALPPWHEALNDRVAALHRAHGNGQAPSPAPYDMQGFHFPFEGDGPPPRPGQRRYDLKTEWGEMYRSSIQQSIVRF